MKNRRRIAGSRMQELRVRELLAELEWERRRGIIAALLPYSGDRRRPRATSSAARSGYTGSRRELALMIPKQRLPLPSEQRLVEQARRARYPYVRTDIDNNRGGQA